MAKRLRKFAAQEFMHTDLLEEAAKAIEAAESIRLAEMVAKVEAEIKKLREDGKSSKEDGETDYYVYGWKVEGMNYVLNLLKGKPDAEGHQG